MIHDLKVWGLAFLGGMIPALLWLWFWLKEENKKEPSRVLASVFILGIVSVFFVLPIQKFLQANIQSSQWQLIFFAAAEEIIKYLAVLAVLYHTRYIDKALDWPIYLITAALGFAAMENALFLLKPFSIGANTVGLLTGQLRFLGSTLLHTVSSGILGITLGISLRFGLFKKKLYLLAGLLFAIGLHSVFNFFIIRGSGNDFLKVFGFLWVVTIIVMLLFEKVRRMD